MPSEAEHLKDDLRLFGKGYPEVHRLLDQFANYPDMRFLRRHRKFLHHVEGIQYVRMRYGDEAGDAAEQHVLRDCGWVPKMVDYHNGVADEFGGRR